MSHFCLTDFDHTVYPTCLVNDSVLFSTTTHASMKWLTMQKLILVTAALLALLATCLGAFGAHVLKTKLSPTMLTTYQTAVQYHFYHCLALFVVGLLFFHISNGWLKASAYTFTLGIILFSGSLYLLSITNLKWIGAITPIGGLFFIFGWLFFIIGVL